MAGQFPNRKISCCPDDQDTCDCFFLSPCWYWLHYPPVSLKTSFWVYLIPIHPLVLLHNSFILKLHLLLKTPFFPKQLSQIFSYTIPQRKYLAVLQTLHYVPCIYSFKHILVSLMRHFPFTSWNQQHI